jgi:hypothetical protein
VATSGAKLAATRIGSNEYQPAVHPINHVDTIVPTREPAPLYPSQTPPTCPNAYAARNAITTSAKRSFDH